MQNVMVLPLIIWILSCYEEQNPIPMNTVGRLYLTTNKSTVPRKNTKKATKSMIRTFDALFNLQICLLVLVI